MGALLGMSRQCVMYFLHERSIGNSINPLRDSKLRRQAGSLSNHLLCVSSSTHGLYGVMTSQLVGTLLIKPKTIRHGRRESTQVMLMARKICTLRDIETRQLRMDIRIEKRTNLYYGIFVRKERKKGSNFV
jgi:hypothetical protein